MLRRLLVACLAAAAILAMPAAAQAASTTIVISEFQFRDGSDAGDEFVELRNISSSAVPIGGWKLQGCAASSGAASTRVTVPAGTEVPAGGAYLFANSAGSLATQDDASYGTGLADTGGVRIVTAGDVPVDGVASADGATDVCREGTGLNLPTSGSPAAFERLDGGTRDTDQNAQDFAGPKAADPQSSRGDVGEPEVTVTKIHAIQGAGAASPMSGQTVTIEGVVTGVDDEIGSNFVRTFPADAGIFVQEEGPTEEDGDPATSEGIYVAFVTNRDNYAPGTRVRVNGRVREQFGETRIEETFGQEPTPIGTAPVPPAVVIDPGQAAAQDRSTRPYYETLEGMNVRLDVGTATVGSRNKFGETFLSPGVRQGPTDRVFRTEAAPDLIAADSDAGAGDPDNPLVDTDSSTELPVDLFDVVRGLEGPVGFSFSHYKILNQELPRPQPIVEEGPVQYPYDDLAPQGRGELRVATYNVENFFPPGGDVDRRQVTAEEYAEKRDRIVDAIGDLLERPDVVALQEVVTKEIADDLARQLGGYTAYLEEGNDERGIDVAFLVKDTVEASNPRQLGKNATAPESQGGECADSDGQNLLFDRPPLAIDIAERGVEFTVISNHFASKGNPDECREAQAQFVRDRVVEIEGDGGEAIVTGDLNSFEAEIALKVLEDGRTTLDNLWDRAPAEERYSFQFGGRLQTLDHTLVTDGLSPRVEDFRYPHINNDYYDRRDRSDGHRSSDHDPAVVTLSLPGDVDPPGPPADRGGQAADPGRVLSVTANRRCHRGVELGRSPTGGRRAVRFRYRLSAAAPVRITLRRRNGSPRWRSCPRRAGTRAFPYTDVGSTGEAGREGTNGIELGASASRRAVHRFLLRRTRAHRRGSVSMAQLTRGRRLTAGTYLLEVASLDGDGRPVSRRQVKFWVLRPR